MKYTVLKDVDKVLMDHFVRCAVRWENAGCTKSKSVRVRFRGSQYWFQRIWSRKNSLGISFDQYFVFVRHGFMHAASILYLQSQLPSLAAARRIILLARGSDSVFCPRSSKSQVSSARHIFTLASSTNLLTFTGPKLLLKPHFTQEIGFVR